jgi:hypothetical protein
MKKYEVAALVLLVLFIVSTKIAVFGTNSGFQVIFLKSRNFPLI